MLDIYRASAGSGKTHLLTGYYIQLLFRKDFAPETDPRRAFYHEILAVTFTNKATAEMKSRIISELHILATVPAQSAYFKQINPDGSQTEEEISQRAQLIVHQLLNDYANFNISTIDSFFQKIVRAFTRELSLQGNYEVELNTDRVLDAAVTSFIEDLGSNGQTDMFYFLQQFSQMRIKEGARWDFRKELFALSRTLLSEQYGRVRDKVEHFTSDKHHLTKYCKLLQKEMAQFKAALVDIGVRGERLIASENLQSSDFSGGSAKSTMKMFAKWKSGEIEECTATFLKWADDPSMWLPKKSKVRLSEHFVTDMQLLMQEAVRLFEKSYPMYLSRKAVNDNIYQMGILADLDRKMHAYCHEEGIMLLSSTNELLNMLVGTSDAPFIYEKTGNRINSYMIDEFQDTSGMQWSNFQPLLLNSLSQGYRNLIVGDVKQSIYRWRGSDWGLLHAGLNNFESSQQTPTEPLKTNYRSRTKVVDFNNAFFVHAADALQQHLNSSSSDDTTLVDIYKDVWQEYAPGQSKQPGGGVLIEFLTPQVSNPKPKKEDYLNLAMQKLPQVIIALQEQGFEARDIVVLGRTNYICTQAAEALLKYQEEHPESPYCMDILSSEALLLSARPVIQTLVSMMQYMQHPKSMLLRSVAESNYMQLQGMTVEDSLQHVFCHTSTMPQILEHAHRPLYELTENLIALLPDEARQETVFLQAFRDIVLEFLNGNSADLSSFLSWWEESGYKKSVTTPEGQNAIEIMTIHKAKGLGKPAVVIPFADMEMDMVSNAFHKEILWCDVRNKELVSGCEGPEVVPVASSSKLNQTIFADEYREERKRAVIDNLNTAYVAFTRAKEAMVIMMPENKATAGKKEEKVSCKLSALVQQFFDKTSLPCTKTEHETGVTYMLGSFERTPANKEHAAEDSKTHAIWSLVDHKQHRTLPHISLRLSKRYAHEEAVVRGNCVHEALACIIDSEHIDESLSLYYRHASAEHVQLIPFDEMKQLVTNMVAQKEVAAWFSPEMRVLNEQTLLITEQMAHALQLKTTRLRPDRMVLAPDGQVYIIDYKTGKPLPRHHQQVRQYMQIVQSMGYEQVQGYIWYLSDNQVVSV